MIYLLDNNKTLTQLVNDTTFGKGTLSPIEATVEEDLNGVYELNFKFTVDEKRYNELQIGSIVKCNAGEKEGNQLFRVVEISKERNGIISVYAQHISYDLNKLIVRPFESTGAVNTCNSLLSNTIDNTGFTIQTDLTDTTSQFKTEIPYSFRACLGGIQGSLLDLFECEFEYNNLNVSVLDRRGIYTDVRIAYGKNLVDLKQDENIENTYNGVIGWASYSEEIEYVEQGETKKEVVKKYCVGATQYIEATNSPKTLVVDFTKNFDKDHLPTIAEVNQLALQYATSNRINIPKVSLKVSFVALWQTNEYKNLAPLERVGLGDTVLVDFPKLNVSADARVIKRVWNVLTERYDSLELGDPREDLATIFNQTSNTITNISNQTNKTEIEAENILLIAEGKQDKLTPGQNIQIIDNVISAVAATYTAGANIQIVNGVISATDTTYSAGNNIQISGSNVISATNTTYSAGTNVQISASNVISATDTKYTAGTNVQISNANVISATDTKYTAGTGVNISNANVISVKDEYVKLVGDTMSGQLIIDKESGETMVKLNRQDSERNVGFGVGTSSKMGMYDFTNGKWVIYVETDNTVRIPGTLNITGNSASKPLRVRNIVGSNGTVTDGPLYLQYGANNVIYLGNTGAYNISADGKTYSGHLAYSTTTLANSATNITTYDNHGTIERYGAICYLDINFKTTANKTGFGLGAIPTGYRPKLKHSVNVSSDTGIECYVALGTDGVVNIGVTGTLPADSIIRTLISYIADF